MANSYFAMEQVKKGCKKSKAALQTYDGTPILSILHLIVTPI